MFEHKPRITTLVIIVVILVLVGGIMWYGAREQMITQALRQEFPGRFAQYLDQGDYRNINQLITAAQERAPQSTELLFMQAMAAFAEASASGDQERFLAIAKETESVLESIQSDGASSPDFHSLWGMTLFVQGKTDAAISHYAQALLLDPAYVPALLNTADALESKKEYAAAKQEYHKALSFTIADTSPDAKRLTAIASLGLARIAWYADQDRTRSQAFLAKAREVKPLPLNLGKAITDFQEVIK